MKREPIIAGNWKMNCTIPEAIKLVANLKATLSGKANATVIVAPSYIALNSVGIALAETNIKVASQNMGWEESGAFTGEVSPPMLKDIGVEYVILGHSERRQYFCETNDTINKKIHACLEFDLIPIVCVGETLEEYEQNKTFEVVEVQIRECFKALQAFQLDKIVIAYEPVWAIGTGKSATPDDAERVHAFIRQIYGDMFGSVLADKTRILYGGSVKDTNAKDLLSMENVDGALVGGASLNPDSFAKIVQSVD
ncbi:MAG: triose-phosphate isomerase [Pseudomonadota bacterium]